MDATATLTVEDHGLATQVALTPDPHTVTAGADVAYTVTATDTHSNRWDATSAAAYAIDAAAGGSWSDHTYTSEVAGAWTVTATVDGVDATTVLIVNPEAPPTSYIYMPLLIRNITTAPNLVIEHLMVTPDDVQIVIANHGQAPVVDDFWVDVYIDPDSAPSAVNQIWPNLADAGLVWGVTKDIGAGETLTLTIGGPYYLSDYSQVTWPLTAGTPVYAQVDSANEDTLYGAVLETHEITGDEYDNIIGPVYPAAANTQTRSASTTAEHSGSGASHNLPPRQ